MHTSKAFRCTLPSGLRDDQLSNIRHWAYLHCAQSGFFRDDRGVVVLVGVKDEFRTAASFGRTIRIALRRLCIDVPLRGRWRTLITPGEAIAICASDGAAGGAALHPAGDAVDTGARQRFAAPRDDDDVRVVAING